MPSPFPGVDPYIEGQGWLGFSTQYIAQLQRVLAPLVRPAYVVFIEEHVYLAVLPETATGRTRPDASIVERASRQDMQPSSGGGAVALLDAPVTLHLPPLEVERQVYLEVRRRDTGRVVCVIELLSPINKARGGGQQEYLAKRAAFIQSTAHLIELDFLRGGERLPMEEPLPRAAYYVLISRGDGRPDCGVWPVQLAGRLPTIPVPLSGGDAPVPLVLQAAYDAHGADPPLRPEEQGWADELLRRRKP
jgi:hypothetical protein